VRKQRAICCLAIAFFTAGLGAVSGCSDPPTQPGPILTPSPPAPPSPAPPVPPPPPTLGITRILAFGDSMTEGTTSPPTTLWIFTLDAGLPRSYPFKLQELLTARYTAQTNLVFNAGRAGQRAQDDRGRFTDMMAEARPELVLLLEGANDLNAPFDTGEGVNDRINKTVSALEDMVRDAGFRRIPVMLGTLPPQRPGGRSAGAASFLTRVNEALKVMARAKGAEIVDIFGQFPLSDIGQDGLHPTEAGYQRMAEIWLDAIKTKYEQPPAPSTADAR
jgi:lysophospholipase L1-like esterase